MLVQETLLDYWCEVEESELAVGTRSLLFELGNCTSEATAYNNASSLLKSAMAKVFNFAIIRSSLEELHMACSCTKAVVGVAVDTWCLAMDQVDAALAKDKFINGKALGFADVIVFTWLLMVSASRQLL